MEHLIILAGSCFPNCHPPAGSGWHMGNESGLPLGALAVIGAILAIKKIFFGG